MKTSAALAVIVSCAVAPAAAQATEKGGRGEGRLIGMLLGGGQPSLIRTHHGVSPERFLGGSEFSVTGSAQSQTAANTKIVRGAACKTLEVAGATAAQAGKDLAKAGPAGLLGHSGSQASNPHDYLAHAAVVDAVHGTMHKMELRSKPGEAKVVLIPGSDFSLVGHARATGPEGELNQVVDYNGYEARTTVWLPRAKAERVVQVAREVAGETRAQIVKAGIAKVPSQRAIDQSIEQIADQLLPHGTSKTTGGIHVVVVGAMGHPAGLRLRGEPRAHEAVYAEALKQARATAPSSGGIADAIIEALGGGAKGVGLDELLRGGLGDPFGGGPRKKN